MKRRGLWMKFSRTEDKIWAIFFSVGIFLMIFFPWQMFGTQPLWFGWAPNWFFLSFGLLIILAVGWIVFMSREGKR